MLDIGKLLGIKSEMDSATVVRRIYTAISAILSPPDWLF